MGSHVSLCLPLLEQFNQDGNERPSDFNLPSNPTRTVRSTFDLIPHTGATSFITWMWSVVIGGRREEEEGLWGRKRS